MHVRTASDDTVAALGAGVVVVLLSLLMKAASGWPGAAIVIRDVFMVSIAGLAFPLWYVNRKRYRWAEFGLTLEHWPRQLLISVALAMALAVVFCLTKGLDIAWNAQTAGQAAYVMAIGVFESVFFYAFERRLLQTAFGIVPGLLLTALLYALHHAGFQPEYAKLFLVGLLYGGTVQFTGSLLAVYPFFWGVGAVYDVLFQSEVINAIPYAGWRSAGLALLIALIMWRYPGLQRPPD